MARIILGTGKLKTTDDESTQPESETFIEWIQRATKLAEANVKKIKVPDWVEEQRVRKWKTAGHAARREDGRWTTFVLQELPADHRSLGRPIKRWEDDLNKFITHKQGVGGGWMVWQSCASDREKWKDLAAEFARMSRPCKVR